MKYLYAWVFCFCGYALALHAQVGLMPHVGISNELVVQETQLFPSTRQVTYYTNIHAGIYYPFFQTKDVFSIGIDPSLHVGANLSAVDPNGTELVFDYNLQAPIMLLARVMRASTPYNRQAIGIGLGIGAVLNSYKRSISSNVFQKAEFAHLGAMLEGNFSTGRGYMCIRLRAPIGKVVSTVRFSNATPDTDFLFNSWGLSIAYGFDRKQK